MAHKLQHTVQRGSSYYYNRRVPDRVADAFGLKVVRYNLGRDPERVAILSSGLTDISRTAIGDNFDLAISAVVLS